MLERFCTKNCSNLISLQNRIMCNLGAVHISRQPPERGGGVSQTLTIAYEGGLGSENFMWIKMWIERGIDLDFTIHDKQSHITCKLDHNKWKFSILSCKQVYVKNCSTTRTSGKCWQKLTRGEGGHLGTIAMHCWQGGDVPGDRLCHIAHCCVTIKR